MLTEEHREVNRCQGERGFSTFGRFLLTARRYHYIALFTIDCRMLISHLIHGEVARERFVDLRDSCTRCNSDIKLNIRTRDRQFDLPRTAIGHAVGSVYGMWSGAL